MRIVIAGNPNAGKTTLFNALTKSNLKTGNWHGVTTEPHKKILGDNVFIDVPGTYSLNAYSMEEVCAIEEIKRADLIIDVIDATALENALNLTEEILHYNSNVIIYVSKVDVLKKRGGRLDEKLLSKRLGLPVYIKRDGEFQKAISALPKRVKSENVEFADCYFCGNKTLSKADGLFYNAAFSTAFFFFALIVTFFITFYPSMPGAFLKDALESALCDGLGDYILRAINYAPLSSYIGEAVVGGLFGVLCFLPQLAILYSLLILLDESGIMSALSFVTDGFFEKVKLSGRAVFSLISGFGCTAVAIATTRGYTNKNTQRRTIAILPFIPCGAKLPVFITLLADLFENPFPCVCIFYFSGVLLSITIFYFLGGKNESLLSEITPICVPRVKTCVEKLFFYVKSFIIKLSTSIFLFCTISWFASHFDFAFKWVSIENSILCSFSKSLLPLFLGMGVTDWRIVYSLVTGFIAKENVAACIRLLMPDGTGLCFASTMAVCTFLLACPACMSSFVASVREVGLKFSIKCLLIQLAFSFVAAYAVNCVFNLL